MATANLSVGINTTQAKTDLQALKSFMQTQLSDMALSINEKSLEASITRAMKGPSGNRGYRLVVDTAALKSDIQTAINDAARGAKAGVGSGSFDTTQIKAGIDQIKQYMANAANDPAMGNALADNIKKGTPKAAAAAKEAGKAAGKAFADGEEEGARTAKISYRFKQGAGSVSISEKTDYTAEQVKARAEAEALDKVNLATQKEKNRLILQRIDLMRAEFEARKRNNAEELKARAASNATRLDPRTLLGLPSRDEMKGIGASIAAQFREGAKVEALKASAASKVDARTLLGLPSRDEMKGIGASIAAQFREGAKVEALRGASNRSRVDPATLLGIQTSGQSAKSSASVFLASEAAMMGPSGAELVAMKAKYDALQNTEKATKQLGNAHKEATAHTKSHAAAMRDAHSAARGLASGFGAMWLTWGNIAPLLAGASLSHGFMQAMKAGSEFAYQLTFVKALGGETAESVRGIGNAALELSKNGLFGPVELANGLRTLSQAGLNATESMKALPVVLDLATVGEMNMKDAAITLVGVMTAFNLDKTDLTKIGDVFAKAAAVSQTSVEQMTQAMKTASVVGEQYGASMGDTATALTLLAKVNITGTAAGTSLRNMLKELYSPVDKSARIMKELGLSAKTATGELRPFPDVIFELQTKLKDFNKASQVKLLQGLFGERGAKEAISMLSLTRAEWDKLNQTITESSGFMREVSAELEGTVKGSFKQAVNTLQVSLIEAYNNAEGAAGKLAGQLKETFGSTAFKESLEAIVVGVVSLTNAIVAMAPALAMAAGGWLALRAAMIGATIWTSVSTALAGATLAIQTLGAVAAGTATTMTGASGLLAAARMLPGVMGAAGASLLATTGLLGPLAIAIGVAGTAWYLFRDRTVEAMQQSAEAVAQGAASMRNNLANILKDVHNVPAAMSRKAMDAQRQVLVDGQNNLLKQRETLKSQYGIKSDAEAEQFIAKATTTNSSGEVYTKTGAQYDAVSAYLKAKAAQREALRDFARVNQTVESVAASEVKPELTTNTGKLKDWNGGGTGGASAKELGRYETNRLKNVLKEQTDIEKLYDAHYKRLVAVENASAQAGLITREEAENKVTQLTEEQTRVRLQINEGFHNHLKSMLATSNNMTAAQKEQIEGEMERRGLLILELQEELELKRELAKIASAGAEKKFQDNIDKNNVDLTRELELAKAAAYGKAKNPIDRARDNGETLVSNRYAQLMQEAVDARIRAEQSGDKASIKVTAARLERLDLEVQQAKKYYGDQYAALAEYQQTGQYGWYKFWEKYQESATTAAMVVEQSLTSVTKNVEDAFADMFKTGKFDSKKMVDSILSDVGRLVAKLAVSDIGSFFKAGIKKSGTVLGEIFGMGGTVGPGGMISEEGAYKKPEGLAGMLTQAAEGLKKFWNSLTGTTEATENAAVKTAESVVKTMTKTTAESAATYSLLELATAARMAAASMSGSSSGGGGFGGLLGGLFSGGFSGATSTAAKYGTLAGSQQTAMLAAQDLAFLANGAAFTAHGIQAFAKGGAFSNSIVRQPTLFRFADGVGMMGEAGPEAIMPLTRDSQGRLGVRYQPMRDASQKQKTTEAPPPSQQNFRIINAFDTGVIGDYLGSNEGEKLIMNVVRKNQGTVKRMVTA